MQQEAQLHIQQEAAHNSRQQNQMTEADDWKTKSQPRLQEYTRGSFSVGFEGASLFRLFVVFGNYAKTRIIAVAAGILAAGEYADARREKSRERG